MSVGNKTTSVDFKRKSAGCSGRSYSRRLKWIDIDFHDCLDEVDVLMGSASTTCMEALARNKYVIIIGNQHGITHNPVPFSVTSQLWKLCYSPAEAGEVIMNCVSGVGKISEVDSIRENYFEPLTRDGVEN